LLRKAVDKTKAYYCLECGVCTGSCPVSRYDPTYSPRLTVERALLMDDRDVICDKGLWSCLTCGTCNLRCPSRVDYTEFVRQARAAAREIGETGVCTHAEKIAGILEIQQLPAYRKSKAWLGPGARTAKRGGTYYFAGCLPYLDVIFRETGFAGNEIGRSAVAILNRLGVIPAVSEGEVCCGHDAYWTGETERVRALARKNLEAIKRTGARRVVFSCPECYHMFKRVYPELVGKLGIEPVLLVNLVAEKLAQLRLSPAKIKVTYQDPCRLVRYDDVIAEPRAVLRAIPELELTEMKRVGKDALCCGSSSWVSCSRVNKRIQLERLAEALETGASTLVTACPKCNIHLRCALRDKDRAGEIEITDLITLMAKSLAGGDLRNDALSSKPGKGKSRKGKSRKGKSSKGKVRQRGSPRRESRGGSTRGSTRGGKRGG
jgi:heterodisulfide reductase subunit D